MKLKLFFLTISLLYLSFQGFSQGIDCLSSDPFCTGTSYNFPASTNVPNMGSVGCLGTTPNPAWYYLQIDNPGPIDIYMSSTPNVDIDFICWGPFSSVSAACATNLMTNSGVSCSYSTNWNETCNIPNGQTGEIYILLITNYSNSPCNINFSQTGGSGTTDCSILCSQLSNNGPLCVGQTLNLTAQPVSGGTFSWTGPNGFTSNQQNPTISNVALANAGTYSCIVTVGGVSSQPCTTVVVINPNPTVTVNSPTICAGTSATLTANGATTYSWSSGLGTGNPKIVSPVSTTTYTVTGTSLGCTGTTIATVTVNPVPTADAGANQTICNGNSATLTATGGGIYSWNTGATTAIITVSPGSTTTYTVTVTNLGCTASDNVVVTVNPVPTADAGANQTICNGNSAALTATGGGTYLWSTGATTASITVSPGSTTTYTVTVTNLSCTASDNVVVTVNPPPNIQISTSNATCGMSNGSATASGGTSYIWSDGQTTATATGLASGNYTVTIADINGCSASTYVIVGQTPGPSAGFSANPEQTNAYIYITFLDNSGGNIVSWQWDFGDGSTATDQNYYIHQYGDTGTYTVTLIVTDANGCIDTVSDIIKIRDISTLYIPNSFTPNGDGINDFFFPQGVNVDPNNFDMYIFDRLGNLMFHTTTWVSTPTHGHGEPWNGTKNNSGTFKDIVMDVYVYRILAKEIQGHKYEYIGRVTLIP